MLRTLTDLQGCWIRATDGDLGAVKDVYFTDLSWTVQYVVVDTRRSVKQNTGNHAV